MLLPFIRASRAAALRDSPPSRPMAAMCARSRLTVTPPLRPAFRASLDDHSCAVPFSWAARPPLLAISRWRAGSIDANPRRLFPVIRPSASNSTELVRRAGTRRRASVTEPAYRGDRLRPLQTSGRFLRSALASSCRARMGPGFPVSGTAGELVREVFCLYCRHAAARPLPRNRRLPSHRGTGGQLPRHHSGRGHFAVRLRGGNAAPDDALRDLLRVRRAVLHPRAFGSHSWPDRPDPHHGASGKD